MAQQINVQEFKSRFRASEVIGRYIHLTKRNSEYYGICPFHDDSKASLQVNDSKACFKCFACDTGGDIIDFLTLQGRSFKEAVNEISGGTIPESAYRPEKKEAKKPEAPEWKQINQVPTNAPAPPNAHQVLGRPSRIWTYHNADGSVYGLVYRFDTKDGKEITPVIYAENANGQEWRFLGFTEPRPLYNLHLLTANPNKTVLLVEGEKCADIAATLLPTAVCVSWQGGSNAMHKTDWSPLAGRKVLMFPDNDIPGKLAMFGGWRTLKTGAKVYKTGIYQRIKETAKLVKAVKIPDGVPTHWDIADATWTADEAKAYILSNLEDIHEEPQEEREETVVIETAKSDEGDTPAQVLPHRETGRVQPATADNNTDDTPVKVLPDTGDTKVEENPERGVTKHFVMLGYEKTGNVQEFYFYVREPQIILTLTASQITKTSILTLAPLQWWEAESDFSYQKRAGVNVVAVQNWIIQCQNARGRFNPDNVRGRGAWIDRNRTVIHCGDYLLIDGQQHPLGKPKGSQHIYESRNPLRFATGKPLTNKEAHQLMTLLDLVNWEREINSYLLAGWCVIAPVCGTLKWRPHLWLTGSAGTGKSWLFKYIVARLLGNTVVRVQSQTTEAGVRQRLANDALPVIFDEAESENRRDNDRMDTILGLVRAASSDDSGEMVKGSANGVANIYTLRSCFAFASIVVQIKMQADRSRISVLGIKKLTDEKLSKERWQELQRKYAEVFTDDFVERFQARTVKLLPVIVKNIDIFASAVAAELGEQRTGDQIGAMIAGAYSLFSDKVVTFEEAVQFVRNKDWTEERGLDKTRDEVALIQHLLEQIVQIEYSNGRVQRNIGELCGIAGRIEPGGSITGEDAQDTLKRIGFKVESDYIIISNTADYVKRVLRDTPWSKNHNKILMRLDGAEAVETTRFASGLATRAVKIPLSIIQD